MGRVVPPGHKTNTVKEGKSLFSFCQRFRTNVIINRNKCKPFPTLERLNLRGGFVWEMLLLPLLGLRGAGEERGSSQQVSTEYPPLLLRGGNLPWASSRPVELMTLCPDGCHPDERHWKPRPGGEHEGSPLWVTASMSLRGLGIRKESVFP